MHQGRAIEDTHLRHERRTVTRFAAFAFDRFNHGAFFAADIGARTTTQVDKAGGDDAGVFKRRDLAAQDVQHGGILVAHVDKAGLGLDRPSGDQHAFQHQVRGALQIVAVFECAGLALVTVDGQIARTFIGAHKAPFGARREARAAKATQTGVQNGFLDVFPVAAIAQLGQFGVAAFGLIGAQILIVWDMGVCVVGLQSRQRFIKRGVIDVVVAQL